MNRKHELKRMSINAEDCIVSVTNMSDAIIDFSTLHDPHELTPDERGYVIQTYVDGVDEAVATVELTPRELESLLLNIKAMR